MDTGKNITGLVEARNETGIASTARGPRGAKFKAVLKAAANFLGLMSQVP